MADGFRVLDDRIARLRILVDLPEEAAPEVAKGIARSIDKQLAAGTDPNGVPWERRKADGAQALRKVGKDIKVGVIGKTVIARIVTKHTTLHHFGFSKGNVKRQILPQKTLPDSWKQEIHAAVSAKFGDIMGEG